MELEFEYNQYSITIEVTASEYDGSDYEWFIGPIYDNDLGAIVDLEQLPAAIQQDIEEIAESKASDKAIDAALDWSLSSADF